MLPRTSCAFTVAQPTPSCHPPPRFGKGDKEAADQAAVDVMRRVLAEIKVSGRF